MHAEYGKKKNKIGTRTSCAPLQLISAIHCILDNWIIVCAYRFHGNFLCTLLCMDTFCFDSTGQNVRQTFLRKRLEESMKNN